MESDQPSCDFDTRISAREAVRGICTRTFRRVSHVGHHHKLTHSSDVCTCQSRRCPLWTCITMLLVPCKCVLLEHACHVVRACTAALIHALLHGSDLGLRSLHQCVVPPSNLLQMPLALACICCKCYYAPHTFVADVTGPHIGSFRMPPALLLIMHKCAPSVSLNLKLCA